jgi:hypothetical protein
MLPKSKWAHRLEMSEIRRDDEFYAVLYTAVSIQIHEHWSSKWEFDVDGSRSWDQLMRNVALRLGGTEEDLLDPAIRHKFELCLECAGQLLMGRGVVRYPDEQSHSTDGVG